MKCALINHAATAAEAKAAPGTWTFVGAYSSSHSASGIANHIRGGRQLAAYQPGGTFEAYYAQACEGWSVWTRYVAFVPDLQPRPKTMTYRICDRGSGRGYEGVRIVTVTVAATCPQCGGPRGEASASRFSEDGAWYTVDRWSNPCGHTDLYENVLAEHHRFETLTQVEEQKAAARALREGPVAAGPFTSAVLLLNAASAQECGYSARQAVAYLDQHGHTEAAALVKEALLQRGGQRWSARKAAVYLTELGAALAADGSAPAAPAVPIVPVEAQPKKARTRGPDTRPIRVVAERRIANSTRPARFERCMKDAITAHLDGDDLATAAIDMGDPLKLAAEIEALAGLRRRAQQGGQR
ncbi:hypothetical protein ACFY0G_17290 [Streptomyces sp. NPDC001552]|uniref:hypothetical protein n=1 Tax=Streptomyces sp. NPDC001552 TaxID=3364587 RepID=UPI0036CEAC77